MKLFNQQHKSVMAGMVLGLYLSTPVVADDIEIYTEVSLLAPTVKPNVMFIMDSSASMAATTVVNAPYDYTITYDIAGGYDPSMIYYSSTGATPLSTSSDYFNKTANFCHHSQEEYISGTPQGPNTGPLFTVGFFAGQVGQFYDSPSKLVWRSLATNNAAQRAYPIECQVDHGIHGNGGGQRYIANKPDTTSGWAGTDTGVAAAFWANGANYYTLFDGNYLNYLVDPAVSTSVVALFDQLKGAIQAVVDGSTAINIGLMQYDRSIQLINGVDHGGEGGPVMYPILDVGASRNDFRSRLSTMNTGIDSVVAETYYEALQYFGSKNVVYGNDSVPSNQVGVMEPGNHVYDNPITEDCQDNYIIVVSNGLSSYDYIEDAKRATLTGNITGPNGGTVLAECNTSPYVPGSVAANLNASTSEASTDDNCLDEMAEWAFTNDVAERDADFTSHIGDQHISTYTVGFAFPAVASQQLLDGEQLLRDTARRGGGDFIEAANGNELVAVLQDLLGDILAKNTTFSSPAVSVNAFNRATNLDDLYFSLFKPTQVEHWEGNLKKFKLDFDATTGDPFIADQNGNSAVDPNTGFFRDSSLSYWTDPNELPPSANGADGSETALGGAAYKLTNTRNVYTFTGTYSGTGTMTPGSGDLTTGSNALDASNAAVTDVMLNVVGFPDLVLNSVTIPHREALLDWAAGIDVLDDDQDGDYTDARRVIGDPLHAEPALVQYGLTAGGDPDLVAYLATNDGYLHAVNSLDGTEYFAFVPQELLSSLNNTFENSGTLGKQYGLDGNVVADIHDENSDGDLEDAGDHVYLFFGMRRGGRYIYSLDVTDRNSPKLRWVIDGGAGDFAELGQTWSAPNVEKILMGGTEKTVLIFGAGYDTLQDVATSRTTDTVGRGIYIVDADTGKMLWRAGPDGGADLQLTDMLYSIPARIKPLDVDGDKYVDRLYAGDMGGQLWRIDIDNSASSTSAVSAKGGRIADLADTGVNNARRFYYPPDAALIVQEGQPPFISIVAASGYRAHPLDTDIHDRMYMIRDYDVFTSPSSYTTITETDLFNTTDNAIGEGDQATKDAATTTLTNAEGWFIELNELDGSYVGEKALSEPLILNGVAIVTTYIPASAGIVPVNVCEPNDGSGAIFFVNVTDGTPTYDLSGSVDKTREDRKKLLERGGIPPTPTVIITEEGTPTLCVGTECDRAGAIGTIQKMYWYEK